MDAQICKVIILPTPASIDKPMDYQNGKIIGLEGQSQHLYFTSDEEIKKGDHYYNIRYKTLLTANVAVANDDAYNNPSKNIKIIASTNPDYLEEGIPAIPESFLKQYVAAKGSIKEVRLEKNMGYDDWYERLELTESPGYKLKLTANNEVCVLNQADEVLSINISETYTLQQVKKAINLAYVIGSKETSLGKAIEKIGKEGMEEIINKVDNLNIPGPSITAPIVSIVPVWKKVDYNNLPQEQVLVKNINGVIGIGNLMAKSLNTVICYISWGGQISKCTHYILLSDLLSLPTEGE